MRLSLLLALVLTLGACATTTNGDATTDGAITVDADADDSMTRGEMKTVQRDEPFTLQRGETAQFADEDDVMVRFDSLMQDSRCPANATCVRAGEAVARFTLVDGERIIPFTLEIPGFQMEMPDMEQVQFETVDRFVGALLLLQPYPELDADSGMPLTATVEMRRLMR